MEVLSGEISDNKEEIHVLVLCSMSVSFFNLERFSTRSQQFLE